MKKSAIVHARIDPATKSVAERILQRLGVSPTEAIRMFYRQVALRRGLPFAVEIPNALTRATLANSQEGRDVERFDSLEELAESWKR